MKTGVRLPALKTLTWLISKLRHLPQKMDLNSLRPLKFKPQHLKLVKNVHLNNCKVFALNPVRMKKKKDNSGK